MRVNAPRVSLTPPCFSAQGGIGMMSSSYEFCNPPQWLHDKHPSVNWSEYPDPPEKGGPTFLMEIHRSCCNDATQGTYETAAVRLATDEIFLREHPWMERQFIAGETSDGCTTQFQCTLAALYNVKNPHLATKSTDESGEGKCKLDTDGGKVRTRPTTTVEYVDDDDRH